MNSLILAFSGNTLILLKAFFTHAHVENVQQYAYNWLNDSVKAHCVDKGNVYEWKYYMTNDILLSCHSRLTTRFTFIEFTTS